MEDIVKSLSSIFDKISEFFDLFDLSFFISGAITTSAILFWMHLAGNDPLVGIGGWMNVLGIVITFYVCGLICFAAGRWIRTGILTRISRKSYSNRFETHFKEVLNDHSLTYLKPFRDYLLDQPDQVSKKSGAWRLYIRLWAEIRHRPDLIPSYSLLKRYWVMAATYDGVAMSLIIWVAVFVAWCVGYGIKVRLEWSLGIPAIGVLLFASLASFREANRYGEYQVEELIASIAAHIAKHKITN
jgi:hypothetical protein